ncbi:hypothetical protein BDV96DRAFT_199245 [Lophiotrema nucula]|uniref:Zn(2)-C6 fungal-type domain-containing protein n=1 Tax=Lophiotrema nucula TaxID=690887 RepID=A0A6A5YX82_9PLEO|nr:hypothetical protein BDV96DRAFT_199245 [Lophiotrema nucula]
MDSLMDPQATAPVTGTEQGQTLAAAYGHACSNCAKAKCKCILRASGDTCERCHRLGKECSPATTVRKRGTKKATVRRAQLEEKLDDLVALLREQRASSSTETNAPVSRNGPATERASVDPPGILATMNSGWDPSTMPPRNLQGGIEYWDDPTITPATSATPAASHQSDLSANVSEPVTRLMKACDGIYGDVLEREKTHKSNFALLSRIDAEAMLKEFRTKYLRSFPFMYLPEMTTAADLARDKPLLYFTICAITIKSHDAQVRLGYQLKEALAKAVVVEGERSIDILLALISYAAWSYFFARGRPYLGMLSSITKLVISDMRLDQAANGDWPAYHIGCPNPKTFTFYQPISTPKVATKEEKRAVLCCFILATLISSSLALRYESMKWIPQLDEAIVTLEEEKEWEGDESLVTLARISRVIDEATSIARHLSESPDRAGQATVHIKGLQSMLNNVKSQIPPHLLLDRTVTGYIHIASVTIYELVLVQQEPSLGLKVYDYKRAECLQACLESAKACCENYYENPPATLVGTSFPVMLHYSHALHTLFRLSMLEDPSWDRQQARNQADVLSYLERGSVAFEKAHESLGTEEDSMFKKGAQIQKLNHPVWKAALESTNTEPGVFARDDVMDGIDETLLGLPDDAWFNDAFGSWNPLHHLSSN